MSPSGSGRAAQSCSGTDLIDVELRQCGSVDGPLHGVVGIVLKLALQSAVAVMSGFLEHFHVLVDLSQVIQVVSINLLKSVKEKKGLT